MDLSRYIVWFPVKKEMLAELGNGTVKMFLNTEQQIERNIVLRGAYIEFMRIYTVLSHMEEIKRMRIPAYYLPHHAILKKIDPEEKI